MTGKYDYDRTVFESESGDITMALAGEALISRGCSMYREPSFLGLVNLVRTADTAFVHGEMLFHDYEHPATERYSTGTYMRCDPRFIEDLKWMGFQLMSCACNHSIDYGIEGVVTNIRNLDKYGMVHAGTGRNLAEARAPAYLDTPKGRVAILSGTTTIPQHGRAGEQRRDMQGRPGANYLRHYAEYTVDRKTFDALKHVAHTVGFSAHRRGPQRFEAQGRGFGLVPPDTDTEFHLTGLWPTYDQLHFIKFRLGDKVEKHTYPNKDDLDGTLERIRDARRMAQWVVVSIHCHEQGATADEPPEHAIAMYRAMIDAGADVIAGTGPHQDRGIEIYKGKPIFYGIGDFFLQNDTVLLMPHDNYERAALSWESTPADFYDARSSNETAGQTVQPLRWQSGMHRVTFEKGRLKEIRVHPVDLGYGKPRSERGRPVLAEGDVAREILERYQRLSKPFGTVVQIEGNVGTIRP